MISVLMDGVDTHPVTADPCVPGAPTTGVVAGVDVAAGRQSEAVAPPGNDVDVDSSVVEDAAQADTVADPMAATCHRHRWHQVGQPDDKKGKTIAN